MRIMIFTRSEWDDRRSLGNTLTALFGGKTWEKDQISSIYFRSAKPNNPVCRTYYQIRPGEILTGVCFPKTVGRAFTWEESTSPAENTREKKCLELLHRLPSDGALACWEGLAARGAWVNDRLISWLKAQNPDIFFAYLGDDGVMEPMLRAVKKYTHAQIVLYGLDDVYGARKALPGRRGQKSAGAIEAAVRQADRVYGISEEMCREYSRIFRRPVFLLQKGCFWQEIRKKRRNPLKFVYAGNLRYGREETLIQVASALQKAKRKGLSGVLNIYTGAAVPEKLRKQLEIPGVSRIRGPRPYGELQTILASSDVILEAESFREAEMRKTRLSFSTKIMDALQSGGVPLGIGPAEIGSINFLQKVSGALVITDPAQIEEEIAALIQDRSQLPEMAEAVRAYSMQHHDGVRVQQRLRRDFLDLLGETESEIR